MHNYLKAIIADTEKKVLQLKSQNSVKKIVRQAKKSFRQRLAHPDTAVIAEIKRHSPSKGDLAAIQDPISLASQYAEQGVAAISVLTNEAFKGSLNDLQTISQQLSDLPVAILRKEFILDEIQIFESIQHGADAVLLIVGVTKEKTAELLKTCRESQIDALVEVANKAELDYAVEIGAEIIGINNRDLNSFFIDTDKCLRLKPHLPASTISVAESGIRSAELAKEYLDAGFNALLIGEALVKAADPARLIQEINHVISTGH